MDCKACTQRSNHKEHRRVLFSLVAMLRDSYLRDVHCGVNLRGFSDYHSLIWDLAEYSTIQKIKSGKKRKSILLSNLSKVFPKDYWEVDGRVATFYNLDTLGIKLKCHNPILFDTRLICKGSTLRIRSHFGQPIYLCDEHICPKCNVNMKSSKDMYCKCCMKKKLVRSCPCFTKKKLCRDYVCPLMLKLWYCRQIQLPQELVMYVIKMLCLFVYF